ncbi:hypothetical protein KVR01_009789 [Diaporthe batatas]|uniref:uncharacterized protein n=1 Tax=Diaporthe batatas TaxID=748121 RepID=UPI001D047461|nr:uncharacterized protein KVR01_009789 [Diaporthe batatas]KAG8160253.1 hypothetical protein KVR01_009789 [Diaporthe batatas]
MVSSNNDYSQRLPQSYRDSRHVENLEAVWEPILYQEMGKHLDLIKEGVKGFTQSRSNIRRSLTETSLERDETAEMIIQQFLSRKFPGLDDLITQIGPLLSQYPSQVAPAAMVACDDDDRRSFTMEAEPGSSRQCQGEQSMGPPPRPAAPMAPATATAPNDAGHQSPSEPLSIPDFQPSLSSDGDHDSPIFLRTQTAKRSFDAMEVDQPRSPESSSKKAKIAPRWANLVTKSLDFHEVEGKQYIFKDMRCGDGIWLVVWCGPGQRMPFLEHPLRGKGALDHCRQKGHPCHDTGITSAYELEDIVQEFVYRVDGSQEELTEQSIRAANEKLKREYNVSREQGKKSRKGKERAISTRSTTVERKEVTDLGDVDLDDVIF